MRLGLKARFKLLGENPPILFQKNFEACGLIRALCAAIGDRDAGAASRFARPEDIRAAGKKTRAAQN